MVEYKFFCKNDVSSSGVSYALSQMGFDEIPVIICVGSDITIGDSLGPIVGTILRNKRLPCIIYGSLDLPVVAQDIYYLKEFVKKAHPYSKVLVIDAAVGASQDVGFIKVLADGLKPGLGANKNLPKIGDASIIGIVAKKSPKNEALFHCTRLGFVNSLAEVIADGICDYFKTEFKIEESKKAN